MVAGSLDWFVDDVLWGIVGWLIDDDGMVDRSVGRTAGRGIVGCLVGVLVDGVVPGAGRPPDLEVAPLPVVGLLGFMVRN